MSRFPMTYCSQCGDELGPGDAGVSHCSDHSAKTKAHTPGPWALHPTALHPAVRSVGTSDTAPKRICTVGSMNGDPTDIANARLIAAAPELLESLKVLVKVAEPHLTKTRQYLAPGRDAGGEYTALLEETTTADELDSALAAIAKATGAAS